MTVYSLDDHSPQNTPHNTPLGGVPAQHHVPQTLTPTQRGVSQLDRILTASVQAGASDIHLSANTSARCRIDGDIVDVPGFETILNETELSEMMRGTMDEDGWKAFVTGREADFSYSVSGVGRFRVNAFHQRDTVGGVFRIIPTDIKSIDDLGLPEIVRKITKKPKGLILFTGPTGSGKSTSLAAMIDEINRTSQKHIMTIEDPIEFVHQNKKSLINQREVGTDTLNFAEALKRVLRQDPDVILVGELRDPETIQIALTAAETGHLVFGTLHTQSAAKTINRILDSFPAHQQSQIKSQMGDTLQAVICQTLLKRRGGGRVAATEILVRTDAIANLIRDGNTSQIYSSIQTGSTHGMHSLDQDVMRLVHSGAVERTEAAPYLVDEKALDGIRASSSIEDNSWDSEVF